MHNKPPPVNAHDATPPATFTPAQLERMKELAEKTRLQIAHVHRLIGVYFAIKSGEAYTTTPPEFRDRISDESLKEALRITTQVLGE